ncbi:Alkylated DNA repair protein alkB-like protein 1 [Aphelenchoides fujianensis]|nr:Alkylated DNA repair protein alkB-like protein 1 [Aphelenchoides fujianensis]
MDWYNFYGAVYLIVCVVSLPLHLLVGYVVFKMPSFRRRIVLPMVFSLSVCDSIQLVVHACSGLVVLGNVQIVGMTMEGLWCVTLFQHVTLALNPNLPIQISWVGGLLYTLCYVYEGRNTHFDRALLSWSGKLKWEPFNLALLYLKFSLLGAGLLNYKPTSWSRWSTANTSASIEAKCPAGMAEEERRPSEEPSAAESSDKDAYSSTIEKNVKETAFRRAFKFYKRRGADVDLSGVLDLRAANEAVGLRCVPVHSAVSFAGIPGIRPVDEWSLSTFDSRPGLYVLNGVFTREGQLDWMQRTLLEFAEPPNITNLTVDGSYSGSNVFAEKGEKLRWITMGNDYDWTSKQYAHRPRAEMPVELVEFGAAVSQLSGLGELRVDTAIVNCYPEKSTLSAHVDRSERRFEMPLIFALVRPIGHLPDGRLLAGRPRGGPPASVGRRACDARAAAPRLPRRPPNPPNDRLSRTSGA